MPFRLEYRKDAGSWAAVPVGVSPAPSVSWGDVGTAASGTTACTPGYPAGINASTSKLYCIATGRSNTADTQPTMPSGWTWIGGLEGGTGTWGVDTGTRRVDIFRKDTVTGSESGTVTVSLSGTTANTLRASIIRVEVPAGHSIVEEIGTGADTTNGTGYSAASTSNIDWLANDLAIVAVAQNLDSGTLSSVSLTATDVTFGTLTSRASTAVTNGNDHRHIIYSAPVSSVTGTPDNAPTFAYTCSGSCSGPTAFLRLRSVQDTRDVYVQTSANITAGGQATTAQLAAPSGMTTSNFVAGRMWDDENGTDTVAVASGEYTELEWCLYFDAAASGTYDFRVTDGGTALQTYTVTPSVTIAAANDELVETASAADSMGATVVYGGALAEAASGADSLAGTRTGESAVSEAASAADSIAGTRVGGGALSEAASGADSIAATRVGTGALSESATATDTLSSGGGSVYAGTLDEAASATDTIAAATVLVGALSEAATAADTLSGGSGNVYAATLAEAGSAADSVAALAVLAGAVSEAGSAADSVIAQLVGVGTLGEAGSAMDLIDASGGTALVVAFRVAVNDARAFVCTVTDARLAA